jgi:hypothetical protein
MWYQNPLNKITKVFAVFTIILCPVSIFFVGWNGIRYSKMIQKELGVKIDSYNLFPNIFTRKVQLFGCKVGESGDRVKEIMVRFEGSWSFFENKKN